MLPTDVLRKRSRHMTLKAPCQYMSSGEAGFSPLTPCQLSFQDLHEEPKAVFLFHHQPHTHNIQYAWCLIYAMLYWCIYHKIFHFDS